MLPKRIGKFPKNTLESIKNLRWALLKRHEWNSIVVHKRSLTKLPGFICLPLLCGHIKNKLKDIAEPEILLIHDYNRAPIMERSLNYAGIENYTVLKPELNRSWHHTAKIIALSEYLENGECESEYIFYCDSDDAVIRDDPRKSLDLLERENCDMLFSNTNWPAPYECMPDKKEWADRIADEAGAEGPGKYLNAGVFIARKNFLRDVLRKARRYVTEDDFTTADFSRHRRAGTIREVLKDFPKGIGSDQTIYRYFHPEYYPRMKIDYFRRLAIR